MLTEAELLQYIYQTTEMGRDGIQSLLPHPDASSPKSPPPRAAPSTRTLTRHARPTFFCT